MISMPVRSPLCTVRSAVCPAKAFVVQGAVGVAVEEAADFVLEFAHPHDGLFAKTPRHVLVGQPLAADDRVHEVSLDGVAGTEGDVIAALDHAGAA